MKIKHSYIHYIEILSTSDSGYQWIQRVSSKNMLFPNMLKNSKLDIVNSIKDEGFFRRFRDNSKWEQK
jgi:hypothetical protein